MFGFWQRRTLREDLLKRRSMHARDPAIRRREWRMNHCRSNTGYALINWQGLKKVYLHQKEPHFSWIGR